MNDWNRVKYVGMNAERTENSHFYAKLGMGKIIYLTRGLLTLEQHLHMDT